MKFEVAQKLIVKDLNDCWLWFGYHDDSGYGRIRLNTKKIRVHQLFYTQLVGAVPAGKELDHLCRVKHCVNPDHLEAVTHLENIQRGETGIYHRSKTHCRKGHPYSGDNLSFYEKKYNGKLGQSIYRARRCNVCATEAWRRYKECKK